MNYHHWNKKIEFYCTHEHQNLYFRLWLPPLVKILRLVFIQWNKIRSYKPQVEIQVLVFMSEIKFDLTLKNSNIFLCLVMPTQSYSSYSKNGGVDDPAVQEWPRDDGIVFRIFFSLYIYGLYDQKNMIIFF